MINPEIEALVRAQIAGHLSSVEVFEQQRLDALTMAEHAATERDIARDNAEKFQALLDDMLPEVAR